MALKYQGGKTLVADRIVDAMLSWSPPRVSMYFEPFVGGGAVLERAGPAFHKRGARIMASDSHEGLMELHEAVLIRDWDPPKIITEVQYVALREDPSFSPALRAFAEFGCSFGGKSWGGYARSRLNAVTNGYASSARNGLRKMKKALKPVVDSASLILRAGDYRDMLQREARVLSRGDTMVVYCDPPYPGLTKYKGKTQFDMDYFWHVMGEEGRTGNHVFVSVPDSVRPPLDSKGKTHWKPVAVITQKRPLVGDVDREKIEPRREVLLKWMP